MASQSQETGLSLGSFINSTSPLQSRKSPGSPSISTVEKKGRRFPPPRPAPKKKAAGETTDVSATTSAPQQTGNSSLHASKLGSTLSSRTSKSPRPSPKKNRAPQPPTQQAPYSAGRPTTLASSPEARSPSPKEQGFPNSPKLGKAKDKVSPSNHGVSAPSRRSVTVPSTPSTSEAPPVPHQRAKRKSLPSIHAQDSIGPVLAVIDGGADNDDEDVYAQPRQTEASPAPPLSSPPPVPTSSNASASASWPQNAVYEEVVPRVKRSLETGRQQGRATTMLSGGHREMPDSSSAVASPPGGLSRSQSEYAEPDENLAGAVRYSQPAQSPRDPALAPQPAARASCRSPDMSSCVTSVVSAAPVLPPPAVPFAKQAQDKGVASPHDSCYANDRPAPPAVGYSPQPRLQSSQLSYQPNSSKADPYSCTPLSKTEVWDFPQRVGGDRDQYDHFCRDHERKSPSDVEPDLYGYDRIKVNRNSLADCIDNYPVVTLAASPLGGAGQPTSPAPSSDEPEQSVALETVGSSTAYTPRDVYAEVQLREKPKSPESAQDQRPRLTQQDSDASQGPPLDPYQGTPMMGAGMLEEPYDSTDGAYSMADDSPVDAAVAKLRAAPPGTGLSHHRRSRSLDDVTELNEVDQVLEAKQRQLLNAAQQQRKQRVAQHSYEYVEVKLKTKSKSEKESRRLSEAMIGDPELERLSAEKWKSEAERLKREHMERHSYDYVEPMRPRLQSFEAPAAVSLDRVPRPDRPGKQWVAANLNSGEELAWDDSDMAQLASPTTATITSPVSPVSPRSSSSARLKPEKPHRKQSNKKQPKPVVSGAPAAATPKPVVSSVPVAVNPTGDGLVPGWETITSELGTYYFHAASGNTQWEKPTAASGDVIAQPDQPMYASPSSVPYTPSLVDETLREMTQDGAPPASDRARKQQLWVSSADAGSSVSHSGSSASITSPERGLTHTYYATCLGYVELPESALTQRSPQGGCVMNCIVRLEEASRDGADMPADIRLEDTEVYLKIVANNIKVVEVHTQTVLLMQSLQGIRLWGVSKSDPNVFAFVARDPTTQRHRCRIYRCKMSGKKIARVLRTACDQILHDRKVKQDGVEKPRTDDSDVATYNTPRHALSPGGKPDSTSQTRQLSTSSSDAGISSVNTDRSATTDAPIQSPEETLDPLLREHRECFAATYLGFTDVPSSNGVETIRNAISKMQHTSPDNWVEVVVEITTVRIALVDQKTQANFKEHRVRFLTFLGLGADTQYCAYIMSSSKDKFWCHVFMCEKTSGKLVLALQKACKARFQRVVESQETEEKATHLVNKYLASNSSSSVAEQKSQPAGASPVPSPAPRAALRGASQKSASQKSPAPESTFLSVLQKLNRVTGRQASSSSNPYFMSVPVKYYGTEDVYSASAGVKYVQEPFERLTSSKRVPVSCTCEVDTGGVRLFETRSKFDVWCPVDKITFVTIMSNHICFIADTNARNLCHVFGPDRSTVSLSGVLSSMEAAVEEHAARLCGGRQVVINDTAGK